MNELQSAVGSAGTQGAPHLSHSRLFREIVGELRALKREGSWLDIGAGHGVFAAIPLEAEMKVVVTEMSEGALQILERRYAGVPNLDIRKATDSESGLQEGERFDVISMISVVHHIPDYEKVIKDLVENHLQPGGAIVTFQDPPFYPRMRRMDLLGSKIAFYSWRVTQSNLGRGLNSVIRRNLSKMSETNVSDMVEYHVVRNGVDEESIMSLLSPRFTEVRMIPYWSSQGRIQQVVGKALGLTNTFAIVAKNKICGSSA